MSQVLMKRLLAAAALQRAGRMQDAARVFTEVASSEELPTAIRDFRKATAAATPAKRQTASTTKWPFSATASASRTTVKSAAWPFSVNANADTSEDEDDMLADDEVSAGLEEDFVDMGLSDVDLEDSVLELSAAEDDDDEGEGEEEGEGEDEKATVQAAAFERTCRNLRALEVAGKKKKPLKKPLKKK